MTYRAYANRSYQFVNDPVAAHTGEMSEHLLIVLGFVAAVVIYAVFGVIRHDRKSREQWRQVDRSKLRQWDEDD